jgi:hypothetical protein
MEIGCMVDATLKWAIMEVKTQMGAFSGNNYW